MVLLGLAASAAAQPPAEPEPKSKPPGGGEVFGVGGAPGPKRVVIVIDNSAGLKDYAKFVLQRASLEVQKLNSTQHFTVIWAGGGAAEALHAEPVRAVGSERDAASLRIDKTEVSGRQDPVPAMTKAFAMKPDAVVLISDGGFRAEDAAKIAAARPETVRIDEVVFQTPGTRWKENFAQLTGKDGKLREFDAPRMLRLEKEGPPAEAADADDAEADVGTYQGMSSVCFLMDRSRATAAVGNLWANSAVRLAASLGEGAGAWFVMFDDQDLIAPSLTEIRVEQATIDAMADRLKSYGFASRSDLRKPMEFQAPRFDRIAGANPNALFGRGRKVPDRICILTATDIDPDWIDSITAGNKHKIPLDVIAFVLPGSQGHPNLKKLCEANGGKFREVVPPKPAARTAPGK